MSFQMLLLLFVSLAAVHTALAFNPRAAHAARFLPSSAYTSSATSASTTATTASTTASDDAQVLSSHSFRALAATDDAAYVGFHETTPMPVARSDHLVHVFDAVDYSAYDLLGARIYITGGCVGNQVCRFGALGTGETPIPYVTGYTCGPNNIQACADCACAAITASTMYFNPEVSKYTAIQDAPTQRYRGQATGLGSRLYVMGGRDLTDTILTTMDVLETKGNTWLSYTLGTGPLSAFTTGAFTSVSDGGMFAHGGKLYQYGGYDASYTQLNTLYEITPVHDASGALVSASFLVIPDGAGAVPSGRGDISIVPFKGEFYVLGGWDGSYVNALTTVESWSPVTRTWTVRPHMLYGRGDLSVGQVRDSLFAIAGESKNATLDPAGNTRPSLPVSIVTKYTVASNKFVYEAPIPSSRFRFVAASYNNSRSYLNSAIYAFGGQETYNEACKCFKVTAATYKYIPASTYEPQYQDKLEAGEIAGIVIGVVVFAAGVTVLAVAYVLYRRRGYYYKADIQMSAQSIQKLDADPDPDADEDVEVIHLGSGHGAYAEAGTGAETTAGAGAEAGAMTVSAGAGASVGEMARV